MKTRGLFLCIHNSARSQMAAAFLKQIAGDRFDVENAGLEPGKLNQLVVTAMREIGVDVSHDKTQSVFDLFKSGQRFQYVISVCDEASAERCPIFPGVTTRLNWSFADPSTLTGSEDERLQRVIAVRDEIQQKIQNWLKEESSQRLYKILRTSASRVRSLAPAPRSLTHAPASARPPIFRDRPQQESVTESSLRCRPRHTAATLGLAEPLPIDPIE